MRRWPIYAAVLFLFWALPGRGQELGELIPVGLLSVYRQDNQVVVETDTGNSGIGDNLDDALMDLKGTASGAVFLDTAEAVVLTEDALHLLPDLKAVLRPSAQVVWTPERCDPEEMAKYLHAQKKKVTLLDWQKGERIPILTYIGGRYRLETGKK